MEHTAPNSHTSSRGRLWFWLAILAPIVGMACYPGQLKMGQFFVPWYILGLAVLGVALMVVSLRQRKTAARFVAIAALTLLCAGELFFFFSFSKLSAYSGPVEVGRKLPAFSTTLADGKPFTLTSLPQGKAAVLIFFRGRW